LALHNAAILAWPGGVDVGVDKAKREIRMARKTEKVKSGRKKREGWLAIEM
jgi:hypothetical protein